MKNKKIIAQTIHREILPLGTNTKGLYPSLSADSQGFNPVLVASSQGFNHAPGC